LTKQEEFLPEDHELNVIQVESSQAFGSSGILDMDVFIYWGVKDIDKTEVSMWDTNYIGKVIWDNDFKFESEKA
jgi:hypothetical protein